jgi:dTDP-4-amino-4,6-dideoxygalactose transaminase
LLGATPVFVDIDPETFNIAPAAIEPAITPRTRALLPVHLYGQPCDMDAIMDIAARHNLAVVEDCAQACGATYKGRKVGTFGDAGCFSFFPSKNLGGLGDGGAVTTNNRALFERVEMLRRHGGRVKYYHEEVGLNSRLDELQAAVLRIKLRHLDGWNAQRRERACRYNELLAPLTELTCPRESDGAMCAVPQPGQANGTATSVYHQYTLLHEDREAMLAQLKSDGVGAMIYYPVPLHLQQAYAALGYGEGSFPHAEEAARTCFSIPMFPELSEAQQEQVVRSLRTAVTAARSGSLQRVA